MFSFRVGALAAAVLFLGCQKPSRPQVPLPPKGDTPEAKLERVINQLKFALDAAQGSPEFGVASQRDCTYRLIPPSADEKRVTAQVSVTTRRSVTAESASGKAKGPAAGTTAVEPAAPPIPVEKEAVLLVYDGNRWSAPEMPESETLKLCFEAALAQQ